jgi:hypothetical protein
MRFPEKSLRIEHFGEPQLEFAFSQRSQHPKDGLFLYGPHAKAKKSREIRVGVVGTTDGIAHFRAWGRKLKSVVQVPPPGKGEKADRLHLAHFPGLEEAFGISFESDECSALSIQLKDIDRATRIVNLNEAVDKVARLYIDRVKQHLRNDERSVDVWILVLPEIVYERCRPQSKRTGLPTEKGGFTKRQKAKESIPLLAAMGAVDQTEEAIFEDVPDFHRRIIAEFLAIAPTQLVRESTLAPEVYQNKAGYPLRKTQDAATVTWNLAMASTTRRSPSLPGGWRTFDRGCVTSAWSTRAWRTIPMVTPAARRRCFSTRATVSSSAAPMDRGRPATTSFISRRPRRRTCSPWC